MNRELDRGSHDDSSIEEVYDLAAKTEAWLDFLSNQTRSCFAPRASIHQVVCEQFVGVRDAHAKFAGACDVVVSVIKIRIVALLFRTCDELSQFRDRKWIIKLDRQLALSLCLSPSFPFEIAAFTNARICRCSRHGCCSSWTKNRTDDAWYRISQSDKSYPVSFCPYHSATFREVPTRLFLLSRSFQNIPVLSLRSCYGTGCNGKVDY